MGSPLPRAEEVDRLGARVQLAQPAQLARARFAALAPALSLEGRALRHLARREHSRAELERKLAAQVLRGVASDEAAPLLEQIRRMLDELAERGLLSDARAAESVLTSQQRRYGSRRIKQALLAKGLAPDLVAATLQQSRATELERARAVWRRRFGAPAPDAAGRARQARFLAARGFDADIVYRLVKGIQED